MSGLSKRVGQYDDIFFNEISQYDSLMDASRQTGIPVEYIRIGVRTKKLVKGFYWRVLEKIKTPPNTSIHEVKYVLKPWQVDQLRFTGITLLTKDQIKLNQLEDVVREGQEVWGLDVYITCGFVDPSTTIIVTKERGKVLGYYETKNQTNQSTHERI